MKFCAQCGSPVTRATPPGDHRERHVCPSCGSIFYDNPKVVVGCILEWRDRILLCRRAIEPRYGYWTLPAGFMENGESTAEGALREMREEAGGEATLDGLFSVVDVPWINQVHLFFRGRLLSEALAPGSETLEATLYEESAIPWQELAFTSVALSLRTFLDDRRRGRFGTHTMLIAPRKETKDRPERP